MRTVSLQITYRKGRPPAACIYLSSKRGQRSTRTEEVAPDLLVDYGEDGIPLGVEIVAPGEVGMDGTVGLLDRLGGGRLAPAELAPLKAA